MNRRKTRFRRMLLFAPFVLVGFASVRDGRVGEAAQLRKVVIVVQDDGTVRTHPDYVPPDKDEAIRLATLLAREFPRLDIEGVPISRADRICASSAYCEELHVYRRFMHPNYRLHIQLHDRTGRSIGTAPRTGFPCRVGDRNNWSSCRSDVVTRMKNLVEQRGSR